MFVFSVKNFGPIWWLIQKKEYYRFCVAIFSSALFKNEVKYPTNLERLSSFVKQMLISFRTPKGINASDGNSYHEDMIICHSSKLNSSHEDVHIYISRGYKSNEVFVYESDPRDMNVYLKYSMINVAIVDEPGFDDVEE